MEGFFLAAQKNIERRRSDNSALKLFMSSWILSVPDPCIQQQSLEAPWDAGRILHSHRHHFPPCFPQTDLRV